MAQISILRDRCLVSFSLLGGVILGFTILALLNMTAKELADIPHLLQVAADAKVIDSIVLTMAAGANAIAILMPSGSHSHMCLPCLLSGESGWCRVEDLPLILLQSVA